MKIGILTHYYQSMNYGGMLQAYALATFLRKKGYDAQQVSYRFSSEPFLPPQPEKREVPKVGNPLSRLVQRGFRSLNYRLIEKPRQEFYEAYKKKEMSARAEAFAVFQKQVPHSLEVYDTSNIENCAQHYDALIAGSDQVWNFDWFNPAFFLDFPGADVAKIAYAASAGKQNFSQEEILYLKKTLPDFKAISAREADLVPVINQIMNSDAAVQTVDPTLLLSAEDWEEIASPRLLEDKYVFCYFLYNDSSLAAVARKFARRHKLSIATIPFAAIEYNEQDIKFGDYRFDGADPSDFLSLIQNAEYVFTDSFHATVFSLLFGKEFVAFPRGDAKGMGSRLATLTEMFGCPERFCCEPPEQRYNYMCSISRRKMEGQIVYEDAKRISENFLVQTLSIKNNN